MSFGLLFKYGFAAALGASCGILVVLLGLAVIGSFCKWIQGRYLREILKNLVSIRTSGVGGLAIHM